MRELALTPVPLTFFRPLGDRATRSAFLRAVPIALLLWWIGVFVHGFARVGSEAAAAWPYFVFGGAIFGTFYIVSILLVGALPAFLVLNWFKLVTFPVTLISGAFLGIAMHFLAGFPDEDGIFWFLPIPVVLFVGVGTAWAWWRIRAGKAAFG